MQELGITQFLENNQWVSGANISMSGHETGLEQLCLSLSSEGHDLIRDHGMPAFSEQINAHLAAFFSAGFSWKILPVELNNYARPTPGLDSDLPDLLSWIDEMQRQRFLFDVRPDLSWFQGHFPGNPILAGVVQLHWAVGLALAVFEYDRVPVEIKRLKFKNIVTPPRILELSLTKTSESEVQFEYVSQGQIHSLGRLVFEVDLQC